MVSSKIFREKIKLCQTTPQNKLQIKMWKLRKLTKKSKVQEDNTGAHFKRILGVRRAFGNMALSHKSWRKWLTALTILADTTGYQWDVTKNLLGTTGKDFSSWGDNRSVRWKKKSVLILFLPNWHMTMEYLMV